MDDKWLGTLAAAVQGELDRVSQTLTGRIRQLAERYATRLPEFSGVWERLHNAGFKPLEFEGFRNRAGLNSFILTPRQWIDGTGAIGLVSKSGRYGGTYAHQDIDFEFAAWISVEFKLYLIKEFQRLKEDENRRLSLAWNLNRTLSKLNYRIHTDAINAHLIPVIRCLSRFTSYHAPAYKPDMIRTKLIACFTALAVTGAGSAADAQEPAVAFTGATIFPVVGEPITNGVLVVARGRIVTVGPAGTPLPNGAVRRDAAGKTILPGLVDTHSHIGGPAGGDQSAPIQPDTRVLDAIDVRDASLQKAQAGGITVVNIMPGSGHLISGQTLYLKLRDGGTIDDLTITNQNGRVAGGLKMANGTNSRRDPPFPGTRAKSAALVREKLIAAREYGEKLARAKDDPEKMPARDLVLETLAEALSGERMVHHHTHRHDDILTVLRLQKEFGFRVVLHHVSDGWMVADEIAAAKAPCSIIVVDSPGGKLEAKDLEWKTAAALEKAGVLTGFHTDDSVTDSRLFLRSAALGVRAGMSRKAALEALTIAGARMLDLADRIGSLEPGKDGDFIVLSGDPFSVYTKVLETWVDGVKVFDRSNSDDRLWATGGPGAGNVRRAPLCCFENLSHEN